jgi:hypothetical protein
MRQQRGRFHAVANCTKSIVTAALIVHEKQSHCVVMFAATHLGRGADAAGFTLPVFGAAVGQADHYQQQEQPD